MASFITRSAFESQAKRKREEDKALNWMELPENVIYCITEVEIIEDGPFGTSYIMHMSDINNNKVKSWGSKKLIRKLQSREPYKRPYVQSLGQKEFGKGKQINVYNLAPEKEEEVISLFVTPLSPSS